MVYYCRQLQVSAFCVPFGRCASQVSHRVRHCPHHSQFSKAISLSLWAAELSVIKLYVRTHDQYVVKHHNHQYSVNVQEGNNTK